LRPHVFAGGHARQKACLLLFGAELDQGRAEQELAVLIDPHRRTGAVVLLFENQPLDEVAAAATQGLGPDHHRQAGVEELALPRAVLLEAFTRVVAEQRLGGQVCCKPGADLLTEGLLPGGVGEIHGRP